MEKHAFVMMPYTAEHQRIYDVVFSQAIAANSIDPKLVKDELYVGPVVSEIKRLILESEFCLADVTGNNPNVMWEAAFAEAMGKPVIFVAQRSPDDAPFNIRHQNRILYTTDDDGLKALKATLKSTISAICRKEVPDIQLLRKMLIPRSISKSRGPFLVAASPLSYRGAYRTKGGWRKRMPFTLSDYVGIRGLMRSFGMIFELQVLPELANPDDFDDSVLDQQINLYCIASPKANRWTGIIMNKFFSDRRVKWGFAPDPDSEKIWNPKVMLRTNGNKYVPLGYEESDPVKKDFGIVLRGCNPSDPRNMIMILAGRSAVGTEASCLAVTDVACLRTLSIELTHKKIEIENHEDAFCAIVSVECDVNEDGTRTKLETFRVWEVHKC